MNVLTRTLLATILAFAGAYAGATTLKLTETCDRDAESVPVGFKGHNVDRIAREVGKVMTAKDQYETSEMFSQRMANSFQKLPLAISSGELCWVDEDQISTQYDAEVQTLWVSVMSTYKQRWFDGKSSRESLHIYVSERNRKDSTYIASNAYGATRKVSKLERDATFLSFDPVSTFDLLGSANVSQKLLGYAVPVQLTPTEARELHEKVHVAYHFRISYPYIGAYNEIELPKLDWPFERRINQTFVISQLRGISVINAKTGKVLHRLSF